MKKILAFDSLRFIACMIIVVYHAGINIYGYDTPMCFKSAGLAVEVFFVLSGFLLANSYYKSLNNGMSAPENCKNYFLTRIKRLYPEYIFALLLCLLLIPLFVRGINTQTFLLNVLMMGGWGGVPNIMDGIWYVVVLFWGGCLCFNLLSLYKDKATFFIFPAISCLCLFYLINNGYTLTGHQMPIEFGLLSRGTIRGLLGITVGIYCFQLCQYIKNLKIEFKQNLLSFSLFVLEIISVVLLIKLILFRNGQNLADYNIYFYTSYILGLLYFGKEKLLKFLSWKIWLPFVKLSYTIYLTHLILLPILRVKWPDLTTMSMYKMYTIIVILCVGFGAICYYIQKNCLIKLKGIFLVPIKNKGEKNAG